MSTIQTNFFKILDRTATLKNISLFFKNLIIHFLRIQNIYRLYQKYETLYTAFELRVVDKTNLKIE